MTDHLADARAAFAAAAATGWPEDALTEVISQIIDHLEAQQTEASLRRGLAAAHDRAGREIIRLLRARQHRQGGPMSRRDEAILNALPVGTVIRIDTRAYVHTAAWEWVETVTGTAYAADELDAEAVIIYQPEEES